MCTNLLKALGATLFLLVSTSILLIGGYKLFEWLLKQPPWVSIFALISFICLLIGTGIFVQLQFPDDETEETKDD